MYSRKIGILVAASLSALVFASPSHAGGLLGVLGNTNGSLITLNSGSTGQTGVLNIGLGGGNGNVADVHLGGGGTSSVLNANVSLGGSSSIGLFSSGGLQSNVNVGPASVSLGWSGGGGLPMNGPLPSGGALAVESIAATSSGQYSAGGAANCVGEDPNYLLALFENTRIDLAAWGRATNVTIVPVPLCPSDRQAVSQLMGSSGKSIQLQNAVVADALIVTSLGRSNYDLSRVAAVRSNGSQIVVYVY